MRRYALLSALVVSVLFTSNAGAALVNHMLNQTNANPTLSDNVNYAQVTIDDNSANKLTFTVSLLSPLTSIAGSSFGIQNFGFNVIGTNPLADASGSNTQWILPSLWTASVAPPPNQLDGFGRFEVSVSTTGSGRLSPLAFSLVNTGLTLSSFAELSTNNAGEGNHFFAAHIAGFDAANGVTSAYFGGSVPSPAAVPLPAAAWLLGSGLLGLVGATRRRGRSSSQSVV